MPEMIGALCPDPKNTITGITAGAEIFGSGGRAGIISGISGISGNSGPSTYTQRDDTPSPTIAHDTNQGVPMTVDPTTTAEVALSYVPPSAAVAELLTVLSYVPLAVLPQLPSLLEQTLERLHTTTP